MLPNLIILFLKYLLFNWECIFNNPFVFLISSFRVYLIKRDVKEWNKMKESIKLDGLIEIKNNVKKIKNLNESKNNKLCKMNNQLC